MANFYYVKKEDTIQLDEEIEKDYQKIKYGIISNSRTQNSIQHLFLFCMDNGQMT